MRENLFRLSVVFSVFGFIAIAIGFWNWTTNVSGENRVLLFSLNETPKALSDDKKSSIASVRESEISINSKSFISTNLSTINLPLFDNKTYQVIQNKSEGLEKRSEDNFTWRGKLIEGKFQGDVVLTFNKGYLMGIIYSPTSVYEIITKGEKQILVQLDQSLFPECGGELKAPKETQISESQNIGFLTDSADRIDVLVVYTEAVKNTVGGDAQAQILAQNAIDATNTAYLNSKVRQRVRLVHTEQTVLTEANVLGDLRADATTQNLRDMKNADMVAMLVDSASYCGIGYVMTNVSSGFASSAYTITQRSCAVGNLSFAHELGHNMGSTHNPENGGNAAYPYSYGHYVSGSYRTVMSYTNPCSGGCTRVPQISNPAVIYNDVPTGLLDTRNNARSMENTGDTVANFRYSGVSLTLNNYSENAFIPRNISKTLNWSSNGLSGNVKIEISRDESTTWETLIASTPDDGAETINVGGRPTKRARVRISSINDSGVSDSSVKNISIK